MKRLVYSPRAMNDLREIALYIADDNPPRAKTFVMELRAKAKATAERPLTFQSRHDISPGLRSARHGHYLILFRDFVDHVRIVRVIYGSRDLTGMAGEGEFN